jgi:uncharacterized lipoprotein YddW (UPF0748 family)
MNINKIAKKMLLLVFFFVLAGVSTTRVLAATSDLYINAGENCTSGDTNCSYKISSFFNVNTTGSTLANPTVFTTNYEKSRVTIEDAYGVTVVVERGHIVAVYDGANGKLNTTPDWMNERTSLSPSDYAKNIEIPKHGFVIVFPSKNKEARTFALDNLREPGKAVTLDGLTLPNNEGVDYLKQVKTAAGDKIAIDFVDGAATKDDFIYLYTTNYRLDSTAGTKANGVAVVVDKTNKVQNVLLDEAATDVRVPDFGYVLYTNGTKEDVLKSLTIGTSLTLTGVTIPDVKFVEKDGNLIKIDLIDPVTYTEVAAANGYPTSITVEFIDQSDDVIIYSPNFHYSTTQRTSDYVEYTVKIVNGQHTVTGKNTTGDTYIPLKGYVLSIPSTHSQANAFEVNDVITTFGLDSVKTVNYAVENQEGVRLVINAVDAVRSQPMVVYYDYNWDRFTGTNPFGTEAVVTINPETNQFELVDFREFGEGTQKGIEIPENSFVLSTYGKPYRAFLFEGVKFNLNDQIRLVGINYIELEKTETYQYDVVNPTSESNPVGIDPSNGQPYPGYRGPDQFIIYTDEWETPTTGTNEWGFEAAIDANGKVIERGVNVSAIPEGGFVISGHGVGKSFIMGKVILGAHVSFDETTKTISVTTTADSFIEKVKADVDYSELLIKNAEEKLYDVDIEGAKADFDLAQDKIDHLYDLVAIINTTTDEDERFVKLVEFRNTLGEISDIVNSIYYKTLESRVVEARSIWHRPTEKNIEQIEATLDDFQKNNMNLIYVETVWNGYAMYPSEFVDFHKDFVDADYGDYGKDYMAAFIAEAHERDIEVHAWIETFFVGYDGFKESNILRDHPEWILYNYDFNAEDGENPRYKVQRNEGGPYVFIDPAQPEVQDFLITFYKELVSDYEIDGFQFDYIRYPVSQRNEVTGITDYAIEAFMKEYGYTGDLFELMDPDTPNSDQVYNNFNEWKVKNVTNFVEKAIKELRTIEQDLNISTAIFASLTDAKEKKAQDWPTWVENGWIDITAPMAYYSDYATVEKNVKDMVMFVGGITYNYAGLAPTFMGLTPENNAYQIIAARNGSAFGSAIFASQNLLGLDEISYVYTNGTHRKAAVLPHAEVSVILDAMFNDILDKADRIYIPKGKMTEEEKANLIIEFEAIKDMPNETSKELLLLIQAIDDLSSDMNDFGSGYADDRMKEDLVYLNEVLDVKVSRHMINAGEWDPAKVRVRPNPLANEDNDDDDQDTGEEPDNNDTPKTDDEDNNPTVIVISSVVGVVVLAGAIYSVIRFKKKA